MDIIKKMKLKSTLNSIHEVLGKIYSLQIEHKEALSLLNMDIGFITNCPHDVISKMHLQSLYMADVVIDKDAKVIKNRYKPTNKDVKKIEYH